MQSLHEGRLFLFDCGLGSIIGNGGQSLRVMGKDGRAAVGLGPREDRNSGGSTCVRKAGGGQIFFRVPPAPETSTSTL
jgi:hypothetical protein